MPRAMQIQVYNYTAYYRLRRHGRILEGHDLTEGIAGKSKIPHYVVADSI